jgi:hypothetical protein
MVIHLGETRNLKIFRIFGIKSRYHGICLKGRRKATNTSLWIAGQYAHGAPSE